jgi:hypothetical protein
MPKRKRSTPLIGKGTLLIALVLVAVLVFRAGLVPQSIAQFVDPIAKQLEPIAKQLEPLAALIPPIPQASATSQPSSPIPPTAASGSAPATSIGKQTKTTGCQVQGPLADPACTPGAILADATKEKICVSGYSASVRDVPDAVKEQVYADYGIKTRSAGQYEMDHLISLELGGSNEIANLFPEAAEPVPGFHEKDQVENYLHDQICSGAVSLQQAQLEIATNWIQIYDRRPKKQRLDNPGNSETDPSWE